MPPAIGLRFRRSARDKLSQYRTATTQPSLFHQRANQHLLAQGLERKGQVEPDEQRRNRKRGFHREWEKTRTAVDNAVSPRRQKIRQAAVRTHRHVGVVVEVFPIGETIVRLDNVQRAAGLELVPQLIEDRPEIRLRDVLEQVAGEDEVPRAGGG